MTYRLLSLSLPGLHQLPIQVVPILLHGSERHLKCFLGRLKEDHRRAKKLAQGLAEIPFISIDPANQHTNMVYFTLTDDAPLSIDEFYEKTAKQGLLFGGRDRFRMVTHIWITDQSVEDAVQIIRDALS